MAIAYQLNNIIKDRYRITNILGQGGVAITYRAINLKTNCEVAIKVISLKQLDNWKQIELFQREAEVLAKLEHPAIPKYIDYFDIETKTDKAFYLVQQIASGKSLFELVENGWRTNEAEVKNIAQQILEVLAYLHSLEPPVIHRDIKPNNLIRSDDGTIYLVDFGAVQNTYYNTLMQGSTVVGTYGYMAPEQFRGKALPATDLYSLGATLLYLLTHRSPAELPQDTLKLDFRSSVKISDSFAEWLDKLLEPDLDDRFASAEIALSELTTIKINKSKSIISYLIIIILSVYFIPTIMNNQWWFLSVLGFYPDNLCDIETLENFLKQEGHLSNVEPESRIDTLSCLILDKDISNETIIKIILDSDDFAEDINSLNNNGRTLLCEASLRHNKLRNDRYKLIKLLLEIGADVNLKDGDGNTPLFYVLDDINLDAAELLLKNGADVNIQGRIGQTPLFIARSKDAVNLLIQYKVSVNAREFRNSRTRLFSLTQQGELELVEVLVENGADINIQDRIGQTPLFNAAYYKRTNVVKFILKHGANINIRDKRGRTPLFSAISRDVAKLIIDSGADVNARDNQGKTALFFITYKKEIVELLLDNGANINAKDNSGNTPLHNMKYSRYTDITNFIKHGANVNAQNNLGQTPLSIAIVKRNKEVVELLIEQNADLRYLDYQLINKIHNLTLEQKVAVKQFLNKYEFKNHNNNK